MPDNDPLNSPSSQAEIQKLREENAALKHEHSAAEISELKSRAEDLEKRLRSLEGESSEGKGTFKFVSWATVTIGGVIALFLSYNTIWGIKG